MCPDCIKKILAPAKIFNFMDAAAFFLNTFAVKYDNYSATGLLYL